MQIFNTYTGRKEEFKPLEPGVVRMYLCGDTVYDYCHIGHARSKIAFDIVRRYLQYRGYKVTFVRNITDIDDNIIKRAARERRERAVADRAASRRRCTRTTTASACCGPITSRRPREHVPGIIAMIEQLIAKGYAYVATNGDVMYSVVEVRGRTASSPAGSSSELRAGARVAVDEAKRDPLDFVLWKQAKPGEPSWPSPWGEGRPGWHIECSAMSLRHARRAASTSTAAAWI